MPEEMKEEVKHLAEICHSMNIPAVEEAIRSLLHRERVRVAERMLAVVPEMPRYEDEAYLKHRDQWNGGNNAAHSALAAEVEKITKEL